MSSPLQVALSSVTKSHLLHSPAFPFRFWLESHRLPIFIMRIFLQYSRRYPLTEHETSRPYQRKKRISLLTRDDNGGDASNNSNNRHDRHDACARLL